MERIEKKKKTGTLLLRALLIVIGSALVIESIAVVSLTAKLHLGIVMPFVIGLPLVLVGLFYGPLSKLASKSGFVRFLCGAMVAVYALFFVLFAVTTALILINCREPADNKPDTVIVLGAGIRGSVPSATLAYRLEKALDCYRNDPELTIVVSGGRGSDEAYTEAEVMENWLLARGVPAANIIREDRSTSTEENFLFSDALLRERGGGGTLAFITSRFHVFRAERIAKKLGLELYGIPARQYRPLILNDYMRECAAIVQYFFTGRL